MNWLQTIDTGLLRLINGWLSHPFLDVAMPLASGHPLFIPLIVAAGGVLIWKQRTHGLLCLVLVALSVGMVDGVLCRTLKKVVGRPRPYVTCQDIRRPADKPRATDTQPSAVKTLDPSSRPFRGGGDYASMPSSHAANVFAITMVLYIYYRRSAWFMLPVATVVAISRVYNGVHYPSDILVGAILGAGGAAATTWSLEHLWLWVGRSWFPLWWAKLPSLIAPAATPPEGSSPDESEAPARPPRDGKLKGLVAPQTPAAALDAHWLRLGYLLIAVLLLTRLGYVASDTIQLSEPEAVHWLWSKHLTLANASVPPPIVLVQLMGTTLWGDTAFGARFFAPLIAAALSLILLRFFTRELNGRAGFALLVILNSIPLLGAGANLMSIGLLSVFFWTLAVVAGWRAVQLKGTLTDWLAVGLWLGIGSLNASVQLIQLPCWFLFFALWPAARHHLHRPGPWLALAIAVGLALPALIWSQAFGRTAAAHLPVLELAQETWAPAMPLGASLITEVILLNPIFLAGAAWAAIAFWRTNRHDPRLVYFFSMGAPLFVVGLIGNLVFGIHLGWIAPTLIPLLAMTVIYWDARLRLGIPWIKPALAIGVAVGVICLVTSLDTNLIGRVIRHDLPFGLDPLARLRGWDQSAQVIGAARLELLKEGKPVFVLTANSGLAAQSSFWLPEARAGLPENPLVYRFDSEGKQTHSLPWPSYEMRKGENAVFVSELLPESSAPYLLPADLMAEFDSVTVVGISNVLYRQKVLRPLQIVFCRGLR